MTQINTDKFRLRTFVEQLEKLGDLEVIDGPIELSDLSALISECEKALLFRNAGPEGFEIVGGVMGRRRRWAAAFGVGERELGAELLRRLDTPQPVVAIPTGEAPLHQVIVEGDQADLSKLPFHLQHEYDGGTYISSAIDIVTDPETGRTNAGCRRLMFRDRREAGFDLTQHSDLKEIYGKCAERGERLPISFVIGAHPVDFQAALMRRPGDELELMAALRNEPFGVVKCVTNDLLVPADAEMVLEGYVDERGWVDQEGPYGEYMGHYGSMHPCPTFHLTAITHRRDVLHQTVLHGSGRRLDRQEGSYMGAILVESLGWRILAECVDEPVAVYATAASNGMHHLRASINKHHADDARKAISALLELPIVKHVYLTDGDVDIFDDLEIDWAFSSRFQADKDIIITAGRMMPMDPSLEGQAEGARAGFDLTLPFGREETILTKFSEPPKLGGAPRFQTVRQALETGPKYFFEIMQSLGSRDGREITLQIQELRALGELQRLLEGQFSLGPAAKEEDD